MPCAAAVRGCGALEVAGVPLQPPRGILGGDRVLHPGNPGGDHAGYGRLPVLGGAEALHGGHVEQRPVLL